jgi:hypothetical protein
MAIVPYVAPQTSIVPYKSSTQQSIQSSLSQPIIILVSSNSDQLVVLVIILKGNLLIATLVVIKSTNNAHSKIQFNPSNIIRQYSTISSPNNLDNSSIITTLINDLTSDTSLLAPTVFTNQALNAQQVLKDMLNSLPEGKFLEFLKKNVKYQVKVLATVKGGKLIPNKPSLLENHIKLEQDKYKAGVYMLHYGPNIYLGCASSLYKRITIHSKSLDGTRVPDAVHTQLLELTSGNNKLVQYSLIYVTPNYSLMALSKLKPYKFSAGEWAILQALTQYVPRVLEQCLITTFKPALNNLSYQVLFQFNDWNPSLLKMDYNIVGTVSKPVTILTMDNEVVVEFPSIAHAATAFGMSRNGFYAYVNSPDGFYSKFLDLHLVASTFGQNALAPKKKLHCRDPNFPQLTLVNIQLTDLTPHLRYAFYPNKIDHLPPFDSFADMVTYLYPKKTKDKTTYQVEKLTVNLVRFCNYERLVVTEKGEFYIATNPNVTPKTHTMKQPKHNDLQLNGGALTELVPYVVWAFYPNKTDYLGPFSSFVELYKALNPQKTSETLDIKKFSNLAKLLKANVNRERLTWTEKGQFFIATNPDKLSGVKIPKVAPGTTPFGNK